MAALSLSGPGRRVNLVSRWLRSPCSELRRFFGRLDRQFTELQRQLERTAVGFGELKVEQAEIRGLGSGAHRAGRPTGRR
jgi:hypothetical protein